MVFIFHVDLIINRFEFIECKMLIEISILCQLTTSLLLLHFTVPNLSHFLVVQ